VKCGVKVWMAAGSETGHVHAFYAYMGKNVDGTREQNIGKNVVLNSSGFTQVLENLESPGI